MKVFLLLLSLACFSSSYSQNVRVDFAKMETSTERNEVMDIFKAALKEALGISPAIRLDHLYVKQNFAFLRGSVTDVNGKEIDFLKTNTDLQGKATAYSGELAYGLLKKVGDKWKVLDFTLSPDDESWTCWWVEHNVPKALFDYFDTCR